MRTATASPEPGRPIDLVNQIGDLQSNIVRGGSLDMSGNNHFRGEAQSADHVSDLEPEDNN